MNDDQGSFLENRVIFLNSLSNLLPQNPATAALRSHYLTKCQWLTSQSGIDLPREIKNKSCPRCCVLYKDAPVLHRIEAAKQNRFRRRLLQNTESVNTRFQKNYLTSLQSKNATNVHNFLVRTCGVCGHKAKKVLQKPAVKTLEESFEIRTLPNKPKKKKKKDRFSGLNVNAVLSVTPQLKAPQNVTKETPRKTQNPSATPKGLPNKSQIRKKKEDNKKKLKGLKNIFNDSSKNTPANSLKNFLNSL